MSRFPAVGETEADPIAFKDGAETFAESDVTLSHSSTQIVNESVGFQSQTQLPATTWDYSNNGSTSSGGAYTEIVPNQTLNSIIVYGTYLHSDSVELQDSSGNTLASGTITGDFNQQSLELTPTNPLDEGTTYRVAFFGGDEGYYGVNDSFPLEGDALDVISSSEGGAIVGLEKIAGAGPPLNGNVFVELSEPNDIFRWDAATFQATEDGETVSVFIEENDGGGWTEIAGPISRGQDITAAPDSEMRFRVELSRTNTSNNPTLDSIHRRWVV